MSDTPPADSPTPLAATSEAELFYLAQHPERYPAALVHAATQELQRRGLVPTETPTSARRRPSLPPALPEAPVALRLLRAVFWPTRSHWATPLLLDLNLLVFLLMVLAGVSAVHPSGAALVAWGSNYSPLTLPGQPWRLLTSCFVHSGPGHLLLNASSLLLLGTLAEPLLGGRRLLLAYLVCGVGGSLASLAWHTGGVNSVGASGSIFGLYGVQLALLLTQALPLERRERLTMLFFLLYFLVSSVAGSTDAHIDHAAHAGGLLTGLLLGGLYAAGFLRQRLQKT
ncbi:rhomboid family intramembrane serine protease [Hymenobacter sp. NBH84]|uniref:rhomboid family intramembrane serine protease n=1 Tax=Hymenobacter sp. NBH84 TaxID=2596915 RepID=UPI0016234E34|nr:rhomboid family intramembrane serine protease [Hymenobacter sp. NBH84]QNE40150.1 rhomboid family intramembrane serine protease [Hymenobacter sp. NBH84]